MDTARSGYLPGQYNNMSSDDLRISIAAANTGIESLKNKVALATVLGILSLAIFALISAFQPEGDKLVTITFTNGIPGVIALACIVFSLLMSMLQGHEESEVFAMQTELMRRTAGIESIE